MSFWLTLQKIQGKDSRCRIFGYITVYWGVLGYIICSILGYIWVYWCILWYIGVSYSILGYTIRNILGNIMAYWGVLGYIIEGLGFRVCKLRASKECSKILPPHARGEAGSNGSFPWTAKYKPQPLKHEDAYSDPLLCELLAVGIHVWKVHEFC